MSRRIREDYRRPTNRSRTRRNRRARQEAERKALADIAAGITPSDSTASTPILEATAKANIKTGNGESAEPKAEPKIETALFESDRLTRDTRLVGRAIKSRWETPKDIAQAVMLKAGVKALESETATIPQLVMVGKLFLDVDRANQSEEHHQDRMDYYERARQDKAKVGEYRPGVNIGVQGGNATANIQIVLPHNFRDSGMLTEDEEQDKIFLPPTEPGLE